MSSEDTEVAPDAIAAAPTDDDTLAAPAVADTVLARRAPTPSRPPQQGDAVGRYVVLERLGAGGMGEVFAAYDPELDRKVALKLLRVDRARGAEEQARLLAEAQALAKLNHPNVVSIHDVGEHGGQVYLAMEFVEGQTLDAWASSRPRDWKEVLSAFERAAEGLAAAHALGMVHRDFKPENVMIGTDGRVRVMDFGLARAPEPTEAPSGSSKAALETATTQADHIMGTPAYMAPEQFETARVGPEADQFAFCVSAWRILYGRPPFGGSTMAERVYAMHNEGLVAPASTRRVPAWLRRVLERGLAIEASARWESLDALLAATRTGRRSWVRGLAAAAAVAVIAVGAGYSLRQRAASQQCEAEAQQAMEMWNGHKDELRTALEAGAPEQAGDAFERVEGYMETWAEGWAEASEDACRRRRVSREWSEEQHETTAACLEHDLYSTDLRLALMPDAGGAIVSNAVGVAAALEGSGRCLDAGYLASRRWPDPERWQRLRPLERRHQDITSQLDFDRVENTLEPTRELLRDVERADDTRLLSEVLQTLGWIEQHLGMYEEAIEHLERSYWIALSDGLDALAIIPAVTLAFVHGSELQRLDIAEIWVGHAQAHFESVKRIGHAPPDMEISVLKTRAKLEGSKSNFGAALATLDRALELTETELGRGSTRREELLSDKAKVLSDAGRYEESVEVLGEVIAEVQELYGPSHASLATALSNRAVARYGLGELRDARDDQERALEIRLAQYGEDSPSLFSDLNNMAVFYEAEGDAVGALEIYDRCLALDGLGPEARGRTERNRAMTLADLERHPDAAKAIADAGETTQEMGPEPSPDRFMQANAVAYVALRAGDLQRALVAARESEAVAAQVFGDSHDFRAVGLRNVTLALLARGELDEAEAVASRAHGIWVEAGHARVGWGPLLLGKVALARGDFDAAKDQLELAVELLAKRERPASELAEAELELARALQGVGETSRARDTAQRGADRLAGFTAAVAIRRDLADFLDSTKG